MVSLYYTAFKESSVEYANKGALTERLDINNCTDLWIVLSFVNSECDAEIDGDTVIWRILKEIWQKFKKTIKLFDLTNSFQSVYSLKTGFIIPLGINDSNGTGSHCKLQKWRNIILIHSHSTSENTVNNFVDSFSLRTQAGQQLWHWAEPGFPGSTAKGTRFLWNWTPCSTTPPLPGKCPLTDMETHCGKQGHSGDARLRAVDGLLQNTQVGSPSQVLTPSCPWLLPCTHTNPCCACITDVLLCVKPVMVEGSRTGTQADESTKMPHKQLCTRAPSPAWQITLVQGGICATPCGFSSLLGNHASTWICITY